MCRCTLGEYWENHTCNKCPHHLYGDGVQCLKCPPGFQVDRGFCHKDLTQKIVVASVAALLSLGCIVTAMVLFYKVKRAAKKKKLCSDPVRMSEVAEIPLWRGREVESKASQGGLVEGCAGRQGDTGCCEESRRNSVEIEEVREDNLYESLREMKDDE